MGNVRVSEMCTAIRCGVLAHIFQGNQRVCRGVHAHLGGSGPKLLWRHDHCCRCRRLHDLGSADGLIPRRVLVEAGGRSISGPQHPKQGQEPLHLGGKT